MYSAPNSKRKKSRKNLGIKRRGGGIKICDVVDLSQCTDWGFKGPNDNSWIPLCPLKTSDHIVADFIWYHKKTQFSLLNIYKKADVFFVNNSLTTLIYFWVINVGHQVCL